MNCSCGNSLSSLVEIEVNSCISCMKSATLTRPSLEAEIVYLKNSLALSDHDLKQLKELIDVEIEGRATGAAGLGSDQCPYDDDGRKNMWLVGWNVGNLFAHLSKVSAVVKWANESLEHIKELSAGYGMQEIDSKLSTVISKLSEIE